jgi:hypothetical protein
MKGGLVYKDKLNELTSLLHFTLFADASRALLRLHATTGLHVTLRLTCSPCDINTNVLLGNDL